MSTMKITGRQSPAAGSAVWGGITGTLSNQTDLAAALALKYDASNPAGYISTISGVAAGGELSGTYPNPTVLNSAVIAKVLTGLSITGGAVINTDTILQAFGKLQNQINTSVSGVSSVFTRTGAITAQSGDYNTSLVTENTNLYFTNARAIAAPITGYVSGAGVVAATDSILQAIQKLNGNTAALITGVSSVFGRTGAVVAAANDYTFAQLASKPTTISGYGITDTLTNTVFGRSGTVTAQSGDYNTSQVTENTNLYYTNARGIGSVLTGYVSGAGTVAATDTILQAIQKLNGNIGALVTGVSSVTGTTNRITSSGGATPAIDISASYVGQSSITTLGTIGTGVWQGTSIATGFTDAKIKTVTGTTNRLTVAGTATDPTFDISTSYVGQATITTLGTITSGTWTGTAIADGNIATSYIKADGSRALTGNWGMGAFKATSTQTAATAATVVDAFEGINTTAATVGNQMYGGFNLSEGRGWGTTAGTSQAVAFRWGTTPVQGTVPTGTFLFQSSIAGGAFTTQLSITSAGIVTSTANMVGSVLRANNGGVLADHFASADTSYIIQNGGNSTRWLYLGPQGSNSQNAINNNVAPQATWDVSVGGLAATPSNTAGIIVANTTAALVGAQVQISPIYRYKGFAWKSNATAASQSMEFRHYVVPVAGAAAITGYLTFESSNNGAAYSATLLTLSDAGNIGIGKIPITTAMMAFLGGTTARAQINLAVSTAPTSPQDGDIWFETNVNTGLKIRINGVTKSVTVA